jgi:hypothetical protein
MNYLALKGEISDFSTEHRFQHFSPDFPLRDQKTAFRERSNLCHLDGISKIYSGFTFSHPWHE